MARVSGLPSTTVVLVHGLWMPAASMALLGNRLRRAGFSARSFGYASVADDLSTNARRLSAFAIAEGHKGSDGDAPVKLHLVGHSTGGVLLLRALADSPALAERVSPGDEVIYWPN
jgi:pimeloyl-ACP methyl ester carboxylesterase